MKIKIKKLDKMAEIPKKMSEGAACLDLRCLWTAWLRPGDTVAIPTGLAIEIPPGFEGRIRGRSGLASRGLEVHPGTIDADYRGELKVIMHNLSKHSYEITHRDRIAQMSFHPVLVTEFEEVEELSETKRGEGGLGSTGQ